MDLGIKGRTALVCASSKGLGRGCAEALAAEGVSCGQGLLPKNSFLFLSQELPPMEDPFLGSSPRFPGRHSLGVPPWEDSLGEPPWESFPGRDALGDLSLERIF